MKHEKIKQAFSYIADGHFIVSFVRWLVRTGGNVGESAFLLATLWVSLNAVAHIMLTWFLPPHIIELFNYLSLVAFSLLPELIIIPIIGTCFNHWSVVSNDKSRKDAIVWGVLYSIPTTVFLGMTIFTISTFVSTGGQIFTPATGWQLVTRALFGWMYSAVNMLYAKLGEPNYASYLAKKDEEISEIQERTADLILDYSSQISHLQLQLEANSIILKSIQEENSDFKDLENYPMIVELMKRGDKTISLEDLIKACGFSKRKIIAANLEMDRRNKSLFRLNSVSAWLKTIKSSSKTTIFEINSPDEKLNSENGHSNCDTDPLKMAILTVE